MINHPLSVRLLILFLLFVCAAPSESQEIPWYDGFFAEASMLHYYVPDVLSEYLQPKVGFRGALGYEYYFFRFAVESGYSHIEGTNPLVTELTLIPLIFKIGYFLPLFSFFGLQADLGLGVLFSKITRHIDALDMLLENITESSERSLFSGARLYFTALPWNSLKLYAGGGVDLIMEKDGLIPLPLLEAGLIFYFGKLINKSGRQTKPIMINR